MKDIVINMMDFSVSGDILDISIKGNTIISELIKGSTEEVEKDFAVLNYKDKAEEDSVYDNALAFFSLSSINGKKKLDKTFEEIKRLLKKDGKLMIWDVHLNGIGKIGKTNIKVLLNDNEEVILPFKLKINPFRANFVDIVKLLENNKFKVTSSIISGNSYYIEALNTKEAKDENFTGSIKRKIYTLKPGNKVLKKFFKRI